ncbi:hypothetical protein GWK47_032709 [Chionoecetes opilio]|uniref:Uncharacterized protein n=1 Tax=Chionoecetes opilio TaxID=41210 RepID=A0A8J5D4A7_CHIOP|nr:hypothetical protein GWK47_032709 [Chionoecetes opilio]
MSKIFCFLCSHGHGNNAQAMVCFDSNWSAAKTGRQLACGRWPIRNKIDHCPPSKLADEGLNFATSKLKEILTGMIKGFEKCQYHNSLPGAIHRDVPHYRELAERGLWEQQQQHEPAHEAREVDINTTRPREIDVFALASVTLEICKVRSSVLEVLNVSEAMWRLVDIVDGTEEVEDAAENSDNLATQWRFTSSGCSAGVACARHTVCLHHRVPLCARVHFALLNAALADLPEDAIQSPGQAC